MTPGAKLVGFLVLLALIAVAAHTAGARLGPVTTSRSDVRYSGGTTGGPGMSGTPGMSGMTPADGGGR